MYTFKNILLTTDLSLNSDAAVPFAVAVAKQSGGTIHLFHAFEDEAGEDSISEVAIDAPAWLNSVREQRHEKLIAFAKSLGAQTGLNIAYTCVNGHPANEAMKCAQKIHADLIVLSTHGRAGIPNVILGSIAEKILRLSTIPVLAVRPGELVSNDLDFKTILVPTDFSKNDEAALRYAVELAKRHGAKLFLAHVVENSPYCSELTASAALGPVVNKWMEYIKAQGEKKLAAAAALLASKCNVAVTTILQCGRIDEEICKIAGESKADLVVMSTHGYTGFSHLGFGLVTERVLRSCPVPLLSIRPIAKKLDSKIDGVEAISVIQ